MRRTIAILACAAALSGTALAIAPSASFASATTQTHSYNTVMTQTLPLPSAGAIVGKMTLSVSDDGTISGSYIPADAGPPVEVTGGTRGSELWLDIGSTGSLRVYGTMNDDGTIAGTATQYPRIGGDYSGMPPAFSFVAKPSS
ncbi:MAG TPA: hypothetical protein VFO25_04785 [Candidatus Eremiobacteraceae bacterium]|nr:hypothetical protein [Candidatus Eremiobacteraceae bacterium]